MANMTKSRDITGLKRKNQAIISELTRQQREAFLKGTTPRMTKYIPHKPYPKQAAFLLVKAREAFYGGAAGGGKSDALLMGALQYVDIPGYSAIIFRKTYADLVKPGALIDRAKDWLMPWVKKNEIHWSEKERKFTFPSGAILQFGYMENVNDKYTYQGGEYQYIGWDELTHIYEECYEYMFSRLRRTTDSVVPLRVRAASNPGGMGHEWVKRRFIVEGEKYGRIFIPANVYDNPSLDADEYMEALGELDEVTKRQLMDGDWNVRNEGALFSRKNFRIVKKVPVGMNMVRYWDLAATGENATDNRDPDYTVGLLLGEKNGFYYILDLIRFRGTPAEVEATIKMTAIKDGKRTKIAMEQEPGATGVMVIDHYAREVLKGYDFIGNRNSGNKALRANSPAIAVEQGRVFILEGGTWLSEFFEELETFPIGKHDDQVDAFSGAYEILRTSIGLTNIPITIISDEGSYWDFEQSITKNWT